MVSRSGGTWWGISIPYHAAQKIEHEAYRTKKLHGTAMLDVSSRMRRLYLYGRFRHSVCFCMSLPQCPAVCLRRGSRTLHLLHICCSIFVLEVCCVFRLEYRSIVCSWLFCCLAPAALFRPMRWWGRGEEVRGFRTRQHYREVVVNREGGL